MGASQGTMNNFTFGNDRHQYYETICGGSGAGNGFDGADCVHTHMTNSRLTDPEVLEWRFPVLLEEFAIRRGSGGAGRWRGGDGAVRRIRFLEPMTAAILSGHRRIPPYGMAGGEPGARRAQRGTPCERCDHRARRLRPDRDGRGRRLRHRDAGRRRLRRTRGMRLLHYLVTLRIPLIPPPHRSAPLFLASLSGSSPSHLSIQTRT